METHSTSNVERIVDGLGVIVLCAMLYFAPANPHTLGTALVFVFLHAKWGSRT